MGGGDTEDNLALACPNCNWHKGPNLAAIDPLTLVTISLFHPRKNSWEEHFTWNEHLLEGKTAIGRATVQLLKLNDPQRVEVRRQSSTGPDTLDNLS